MAHNYKVRSKIIKAILENPKADQNTLFCTYARLPNARMLNIWLNIKNNNCSLKKIKLENVMQQPMDSCICGINTSSESILIRSYLLFAR